MYNQNLSKMKEYIYIHCSWKVFKKALTASTFWHHTCTCDAHGTVPINLRITIFQHCSLLLDTISGTKKGHPVVWDKKILILCKQLFIRTCLMGKGSGKLSVIQSIKGANYIHVRLAQGKPNLETTSTCTCTCLEGMLEFKFVLALNLP